MLGEPLIHFIFFLLTLLNRQGVQDQPLTCPADREGLDPDRVNVCCHRFIQERIKDKRVNSPYRPQGYFNNARLFLSSYF